MPKGFHFRFITLAGFHANNFSMFDLAQKYRERGMVIPIYISDLKMKTSQKTLGCLFGASRERV